MGLVTMLMLEWISPNEVVLGHYVIITKISSIFAVMSGAFGFLMAPYYSGLKDNNRLKNFQKFANKQIIIGLIWLMVCITIFLTFREIIFKAYSIDFDHATFAIIMLLFGGGYLFSIIGVSETICLLNDINKVLYPVSFLQLITLGLLCYILIPHFSFLGAIYAFFISETFCALICWFIVRFHGIKIKIFGFI